MSNDSDYKFVTVDAAVSIARDATGLNVTRACVAELLNIGLLPNFGDRSCPQILGEHAKHFIGEVWSATEPMLSPVDVLDVPPGGNFTNHVFLRRSRGTVMSFDPQRASMISVRAFLRSLKVDRERDSSDRLQRRAKAVQLDEGVCLWLADATELGKWLLRWELASSVEARISPAEAACVPSIYGSKARLSRFLIAAIRQELPPDAHVCDLMSGTGVISRQLATYYYTHANDASPFAAALSRSQVVGIDAQRTEELVALLAVPFHENLTQIMTILGPALQREEEYLHGGLSAERLEEYREFAMGCTRFVPGWNPEHQSRVWDSSLDTPIRRGLSSIVLRGRAGENVTPAVLATAYWGNCYFGLRQAAEVDSLCLAIQRVCSGSERDLLSAVLLAAADACASGPHYAQPPSLRAREAVASVLERRARSVFAEFQQRLWFASRRRFVDPSHLYITNLPWDAGLAEFVAMTNGAHMRGIYVDPPYSRLQYSRFYHVFDTLLRYDYPQCVGKGRTSEVQKRFSSPFDSREGSASEEFRRLFEAIAQTGATVFASYAAGQTVPLLRLLDIARAANRSVSVHACPVRHHSQGRLLANSGDKLEVLIVGHP